LAPAPDFIDLSQVGIFPEKISFPSGRIIMNWPTIRKDDATRAAANLTKTVRAQFGWDEARNLLDGLPGGGLNIAHEALDRHVTAGHGDQIAIRWFSKDGPWDAEGWYDIHPVVCSIRPRTD
jgi:hypothetical protein